ncbi:MAG: 16S rRNA (cytidine(1402)-2'-O)-methyltransferase [Pseudomonadota bacterium]
MSAAVPRAASATIHARGHANVRASHAKTLELIDGTDLTASGTCIIGVEARYDEEALLALRGGIRVHLAAGAHEDVLTARINPLYRRGDPLILRRSSEPGPRSFAIAASKGAAQLDRALIAALAHPEAELRIDIESLAAEDEIEAGALFVVGMPIGNEADISLRALDTLQSVDLVAAEDTRTIRGFLDRHGIRCRSLSYHDHNERGRTLQILERLDAGDRVALVSEAGMPLLSDPGFHLVRAAREAGHLITVVPGPDSVTSALSVSGLPPNDFRFIGFLPRKRGAREQVLAGLKSARYTTLLFEAPHRLLETLEDLRAAFGERDMAVCRNLTKFGEEVLRGTPADLADKLAERGQVRGEIVLVIAGAPEAAPAGGDAIADDLGIDVRRLVAELIGAGTPAKVIAGALAAATGVSRRDAYATVTAVKNALDTE